jgi:large subunit ribosomal protein L25
VRNLQRDPIKDVVLHADLYKISMDIELTVSVPIVIEGESQVVSDAGGIINQLLHEIQIQCLPSLIPHELTIDVSHLGLGDVLHVQDIQVPAGIRLLAEATEVVVSVSVPLPEEAGAATSSVEAETPASGLESEER